MKSPPIVTIIIPTFNRRTFLPETLESVFAQTYARYEVLVVDDGSTDGTRQALSPYGERLRYIWKPNGGEASARNVGLAQCRTDYVAFLDSDDLWDRMFLETVMTHFKKHPELALISTGHTVVPTGRRRPGFRQKLLQGDLFVLLFKRNFITASAVVVHRESLLKTGRFNEDLEQSTDYDMWLRIAERFPIALINKPLCYWRQHEGNISRSELRHRQLVLDVVARRYDPSRISHTSYNLRRSCLTGSLGRAYLRSSDIGRAQMCFREALRLTPWRLRAWGDTVTGWIADKTTSRRIPSSGNDNPPLSHNSSRIKDRHGIAWISRRIRHRVAPGALILCYHRLGNLPSDPHSLSIRVECFAEQMEQLCRLATPIHLSELVADVSRGSVGSGTVVVTFDDGYASVLDQAYPILKQHGIPATVFITSGYLGSNRESWSDELEQLLLQPGTLPERLSLVIEGLPLQWRLDQFATYTGDDAIRYQPWTMTSRHDPTPRHRLFRVLSNRLLPLPDTRRLLVLEQLLLWSGHTPILRPTHRFLSPEELANLSAGHLMDIGSHSVSHPVLPKLPIQQQQDEIVGSRTALESITGRRIRLFSYPYGARSADTIALVKQAGLDGACITFSDIVFSTTDPLQLPRIQAGNWDAQTFARRLGLATPTG